MEINCKNNKCEENNFTEDLFIRESESTDNERSNDKIPIDFTFILFGTFTILLFGFSLSLIHSRIKKIIK